MDATKAERVWCAAALMVAEVELRAAQARGDGRAAEGWKAEIEGLERWARVLMRGALVATAEQRSVLTEGRKAVTFAAWPRSSH
jgi:hypothetical protein